ncbi:MAG TPA: hypothetical protein VMM60_06865 [Ilumatobacter sp.]|nr:hypothetical protein [Ilumatobacter sp.]
MMRWRTGAVVAAVMVTASACAVDSGVVTLSAAPAPAEGVTVDTLPVLDDPFTPASTPETVPTDPANTQAVPNTTVPGTTLPPILEPELYADIPLADVVNVGDSKPDRNHDAFVAVALADIEGWLIDEFPALYGEDFEVLGGGIYAGYPERSDDLPGCGEPRTTYDELRNYAAFYCEFGDFMAYDDGDNGILVQLSDAFGPAVMGIVLAHEYGHAVQARIGAFDDPLPTVFTEQQADCFAGAWAGRAYRGESDLLRLGDRDLRSGLIAMVEVRDPVGLNQLEDGGHGSAFDRVGAFQEGFVNGLSVCVGLLDDPLTLMPNVFQTVDDQALGGNAAYDCSELPVQFQETCTDAPEFLSEDLNDFWATIDPEFEPLTPFAVTDFASFSCPNRIDITAEVAYCPDTAAVAYDEPAVLDLYRDYGDFTLGYFFGIAWAEVAQIRADSPLVGEPRALLNDCLTGAWVLDITPDEDGNINRADSSGVSASPGDLDEAIQMAILVGDVGANVNIIGSPFEKIASFRSGVIGGQASCDARFDLTP